MRKNFHDSSWFDFKESRNKKDEMKTLSATEMAVLRRFIKDVIEVIKYDDTGITYDLDDGAAAAAEILGIIYIPVDEDDSHAEEWCGPDPKSDDEE